MDEVLHSRSHRVATQRATGIAVLGTQMVARGSTAIACGSGVAFGNGRDAPAFPNGAHSPFVAATRVWPNPHCCNVPRSLNVIHDMRKMFQEPDINGYLENIKVKDELVG